LHIVEDGPVTDTLNPYASPKASLNPQSSENLWRDGKILVMRHASTLPPNCVKCNEPAKLPLKERKIYWHQPWLYIFALFGLLPYAVMALIVRKQATIAPGLCPVHGKHRLLGIALGWGGSLLALSLLFLGGRYDYCALMVAAFLGALIAGLILTRILQPQRIDKDFIRLKGCCQAFLDRFPEFHG
jgi:hypothetical protein